MNTGHDGSLTTVHSNSPRDCIGRLETLALMAGMDLPISVIRRQIASAVQLIVQQSRLKDGSRKIIQITELQGMEGKSVTLQDLFIYQTPDHRGAGASHIGGGTLQSVRLPSQVHGATGRSGLQAKLQNLRRWTKFAFFNELSNPFVGGQPYLASHS